MHLAEDSHTHRPGTGAEMPPKAPQPGLAPGTTQEGDRRAAHGCAQQQQQQRSCGVKGVGAMLAQQCQDLPEVPGVGSGPPGAGGLLSSEAQVLSPLRAIGWALRVGTG